jgi:hypothetical protein
MRSSRSNEVRLYDTYALSEPGPGDRRESATEVSRAGFALRSLPSDCETMEAEFSSVASWGEAKTSVTGHDCSPPCESSETLADTNTQRA